MNKELLEALEILEKEKNISKETMLEAIENSLITACKNHFGKADNIKVNINPETCDFAVLAEKEVVEEDGETLYLLHTEDSIGNKATYQIVQGALNERMTAEDVHKQIRRGRYYRLKLTDGEQYGCDYPVICGAATLIDGFTEETEGAH